MKLTLDQFGLSRGKVRTLLCFAAFWIGLQVLIVVLMLNCYFGTGQSADYITDCMRDVERIRIAILHIIRSLLEIYVGIFFVYCLFKKHRKSAVGKVSVGLALTAAVVAGGVISNLVVEASFSQAVDRAAPLIAALNKYVHSEGHSPQSLQQLVPKYIAVIPHTGLGTPHDYDYVSDQEKKWALVLPYYFLSPRKNFCLVYRQGQRYEPGQEPSMLKQWVFADGSDLVD